MTALLSSLRADLLSRRLLPVVIGVGLLLAAAVAYAVLGGGGSTPATPAAARPSSGASGVSLSAAPTSPNQAVAEVVSGARYQRQEGAHNPFVPLPTPVVVSRSTTVTPSAPTTTGTSAPSSGSGGSTGSGGSSGSGSSGGSGSTPAPSPKPKPSKPQTVYHVAVMFGPASTTPGQPSQLTPFEDIKRLTPLPTTGPRLVVFTGVSSSGKGATFALVGEAILHGPAACLPSQSQCQVLDMAVGQTETLEYLAPTGQTTAYELKLVSITKVETKAVTARHLDERVSRAGSLLLRRYGPPLLSELSFSASRGVLVWRHH